MKVTQVAELVNSCVVQILGEGEVLATDLSNVVDIGTKVLAKESYDGFTGRLIDRIARVDFDIREYKGVVPKIMMDAYEFGAIKQKIRAEMPVAEDDPSWNLIDKRHYDQDVFIAPKVHEKFFTGMDAFQIKYSITEKQVKTAFSNAGELVAFINMLHVKVNNAKTIRVEAMIRNCINNMIGQVVYANMQDGTYTGVSTSQCVNLLHLYNTEFTKTLTPAQAVKDPEFIRYASLVMSLYIDRMKSMSTIFNSGNVDKFTPEDKLHLVMLSDFDRASKVYLQSDTYHKELVALPNAETIPFWQGSGTDYGFNSISDIHVNIKTGDSTTAEVNFSGVLAIMFDREALGVSNEIEKVTSHYNAEGDFTAYFDKCRASYFNDLDENFVVFYVA